MVLLLLLVLGESVISLVNSIEKNEHDKNCMKNY